MTSRVLHSIAESWEFVDSFRTQCRQLWRVGTKACEPIWIALVQLYEHDRFDETRTALSLATTSSRFDLHTFAHSESQSSAPLLCQTLLPIDSSPTLHTLPVTDKTGERLRVTSPDREQEVQIAQREQIATESDNPRSSSLIGTHRFYQIIPIVALHAMGRAQRSASSPV